MPVGTIESAKELAVTYQPLVLADIEFLDGSILRLSTHNLASAEGGTQFGGFDYFGRLSSEDLGQIQALADGGIDVIPHVTLHIADADSWVYTNWIAAKGAKGARMKCRLVLWEVGTANFSSNSRLPFVGICGRPEVQESEIVLSAVSMLNMSKVTLPSFKGSRRCPYPFPATTEQKALAVWPESRFFPCGVTNPSFTSCEHTKENCATNANSLRFGGWQWDPPAHWKSKSYLQGKDIEGDNSSTDDKYQSYVPITLGKGWVTPVITNIQGDGNSTRFECVLGFGEVDGTRGVDPGAIERVLVNGYDIPFHLAPGADKLFRWNWINPGHRDGFANDDLGWDGKGDPYGSQVAISIVVFNNVAASNSKPRVSVLMRGQSVRVYSDPVTYAMQWSDNPSWLLLDVLHRSNWSYDDLDIQSFMDAAAYCDEMIDAKDASGSTVSQKRFTASLVIDQPTSAADVVRGLRTSFNAILLPDTITGLLTVFIEHTLAEQQPSTVTGSNYNSAVVSMDSAGSAANGYVAYCFTESDYVTNRDGTSSFKILPRDIASAPNKLTVKFADRNNLWVEDTLTVTDADDLYRAGQEVSGGLPILGIDNFDQAKRVLSLQHAKMHRGNDRQDTDGSDVYEFQTSIKAAHLHIGHLVLVNKDSRGLSNILCRVEAIQCYANMERSTLTVRRIYDIWYTDAFGQEGTGLYSLQNRQSTGRPPAPWMPYEEPGSDVTWAPTEYQFGIRQWYAYGKSRERLARIGIKGKRPVNHCANLSVPMVKPQARTSPTGGTVNGGVRYFIAVCPKDASGALGALSEVSYIDVPSGTTATVSLDILLWDPDTSGCSVFMSTDRNTLHWQKDVAGTPSSVTVTDYLLRTRGAPDVELRKLRARVGHVIHSGAWGQACSAVGTGTLTIPGAGSETWTNYRFALLSRAPGVETFVPVKEFRVISQAGNVFTVSPDPLAAGIVPGDVFTARFRPIAGSDGTGNYIQDANLVNALTGGTGLDPAEEVGKELFFPKAGWRYRVKAATSTKWYIEGDWIITPDPDALVLVVEPGYWITQDSTLIDNSDPAAVFEMDIPVENLDHVTLYVEVASVGDNDRESIRTLNPTRELFVQGEFTAERQITVSANYTVQPDDQIIYCNTSGGSFTVYLPTAASFNGRRLKIIKITNDVHTVTISPYAGDTIQWVGSLTLTSQGALFSIVAG
jgi:hypothetical protein